jgi:hypothetical protein
MKIVQDTIKENKKRIIKQSLGAIPKMIKIMEENGNEK